MKRLAVMATLAFVACSKGGGAGAYMDKANKGQELYATIKTNQGDVVLKLFSKEAPKTVANFVGLATGEKEWKNPATGESMKGKALYDGTVFHRVIPGFMIQGGDPLGSGRGDPGYRFEDEQNGKTFDKPGILAMANAGPNTNGSQFFITTATPSHLNGRHTIFGEVTKGYDVVQKISEVERGPGDRPMQEVKIANISITDTAP